MDLAYFIMLIHELLDKDSDIDPEEAPMVVLGINSAMFMDNSGKDTKHTKYIPRRVNFVRNGKNKNAQDWLMWRSSEIGRHWR